MSRIDSAKLHSQTSGSIPASRLARALARGPEQSPASFETRNPVRGAAAFQPMDERVEIQKDALPSVAEVAATDLEPIAQMGGDRLLGEIARIELMLADHREQISDPDDAQALDAATGMLSEIVRRMRLIHSGNDALVLKR